MILIGQNTKSVLWYVEKMVFGDKNSDQCLFHNIKSFELKNIRYVFKNKEKMFFDGKNLDLCCDDKKKLFLIVEKKM